ncbi:hypothetical protein B5807_04810 [Epicoccum nigrum]|uniref:Uncharacterized protein n=1 Tax=Epicoccum nigrum TaxID=105696 RepID=A0A1Y2M2W8_EPING|nr:hypothetical protein B5807_04810 [Epicoccum nigrum]
MSWLHSSCMLYRYVPRATIMPSPTIHYRCDNLTSQVSRMHFFSILTGAAIFALTASAIPLEARQDELKPFEVTGMASSSPPGRPGSTPWRYIRASATDPNSYFLTEGTRNLTIPAGSQGINCEARWYRGESSHGRTWPCDYTENGHWALQVLPGTSDSDSDSASSVSVFKLRFIHAVEPGAPYANTRYEAEASFSAENIVGRCAPSGWCNYALSSAAKPLLAPAMKTL